MSDSPELARYYSVASRSGLYPNEANLRRYLQFLFGELDFEGVRVLDVGAGAGLLGVYACCRGATAVCLEPESAGSSAGMQRSFEELKEATGTEDRAVLLPLTLQDYDFEQSPFDLVIMHNSINHLDEKLCERLHVDEAARAAYRRILQTVADAMPDGGTLLVTDCSRRNLFGDLGMRSPFARTIEWHKHQTPGLWISLLVSIGYRHPIVRWMSYNSLGAAGRALLGNRVASYLLTSHFSLTMTKSCASA